MKSFRLFQLLTALSFVFCLQAMEDTPNPSLTSTNNATDQTGTIQKKIEQTIYNFLVKHNIDCADETISSCCGQHNKAELYLQEDIAREISESFLIFSIPASQLEQLLTKLPDTVRDIIIINKIPSNQFKNTHIIDKDLRSQIPTVQCAHNSQLIQPTKKRSIDLLVLQKTIMSLVHQKPKKNTIPDYNIPSEYYTNGSPTLPRRLNRSAEKMRCVFCHERVNFENFQANIIFCPSHIYCEGCFFAFIDAVKDCHKCRKFEDSNKIYGNSEHNSTTTYSGKHEIGQVNNTATSTPRRNNESKTELVSPNETTPQAAYAILQKNGYLDAPKITGNCLFCYEPLSDLGVPIIFCPEHVYCANCFPHAFDTIRLCPNCKKPEKKQKNSNPYFTSRSKYDASTIVINNPLLPKNANPKSQPAQGFALGESYVSRNPSEQVTRTASDEAGYKIGEDFAYKETEYSDDEDRNPQLDLLAQQKAPALSEATIVTHTTLPLPQPQPDNNICYKCRKQTSKEDCVIAPCCAKHLHKDCMTTVVGQYTICSGCFKPIS